MTVRLFEHRDGLMQGAALHFQPCGVNFDSDSSYRKKMTLPVPHKNFKLPREKVAECAAGLAHLADVSVLGAQSLPAEKEALCRLRSASRAFR